MSAAHRSMRVRRWCAIVALVFSVAWPAAQAKVHALVVGIDHYQSLPPLEGAVNDARDIAAALEAVDDSEVRLLLDREATHARIREHWFAMLDKSRTGDTLVFSYAGHGSRVPELIKGSEADGQDDVFVLAGFEPNDRGMAEMIRDNQLFEWFSAAEGKGVQVLFVADSCHSGTMTRAVDSRVGARRTRQVKLDFGAGLERDLLVEAEPGDPNVGRSDLPFLTFLSAGLETQEIPEISIKSLAGESSARGALSYVLARALEGEADRNGDLSLSRDELRRYVLENVRVLSERQQTPELSPLTQPQQKVLPLSSRGLRLPSGDAAAVVSLFAEGLDVDQRRRLLRQLPSVSWAQTAAAAELYLDASRGELLSNAGDVLVTGLRLDDWSNLQARVRGAVAKRIAMQSLREAARGRLLRTGLSPDATSHRAGERVEPSFSGMSGGFLIVLNIAGDGTLQLVYPLSAYGDPIEYGVRDWRLPLQVSPPYGEDHMLAFAFDSPQPEILQALNSLDGSRSPQRAVSMMLPHLYAADVEVGIVAMFSRP